jgi:hypothetical protein
MRHQYPEDFCELCIKIHGATCPVEKILEDLRKERKLRLDLEIKHAECMERRRRKKGG